MQRTANFTIVAAAINGKICPILRGGALNYLSQKPTRRLLLLFKKVKFEADVVKFSDFSNPYRKDWRHELEFKFDRSEFMDELNKITSITNSQIS